MTMRKCNVGHWYDADQYRSCPYCGGMGRSSGLDITRPLELKKVEGPPTIPSKPVPPIANQALSYKLTDPAALNIDPVVGILLCIEGRNCGRAYELHKGYNHIGKDPAAGIALNEEPSVDTGVYACIVYDAKNNRYDLLPGGSATLCYLNDGEAVLERSPLARNDVLKVGSVRLMFFPCCDEAFSWQQAE